MELHPSPAGDPDFGMAVIVPQSPGSRPSGGRPDFVAIDFETADHGPDSACAVGLVRVSGATIVNRKYYLIRPTRSSFFFTPVHGITWEHVERQPTFELLWPRIRHLLLGADFIASHSVSFDRRVLETCCRAAMVPPPEIRYVCTVKLARRVWDIRPTNLSNVCTDLGLSLNHHKALSDAEACAGIVIAAFRCGAEI
jgi:DNA polymerase-3 subunit epsilon